MRRTMAGKVHIVGGVAPKVVIGAWLLALVLAATAAQAAVTNSSASRPPPHSAYGSARNRTAASPAPATSGVIAVASLPEPGSSSSASSSTTTTTAAPSRPAPAGGSTDPTEMLKKAAEIIKLRVQAPKPSTEPAAADASAIAGFPSLAATLAAVAPPNTLKPASAASAPLPASFFDTSKVAAAPMAAVGNGGAVVPSDGPYNYQTGLQAITEMLRANATNDISKVFFSMKDLGWLVRSYYIAGDPLVSIRINREMEQLVQNALTNSISQMAGIPSQQVLVLANANVTEVLSVKGVNWSAGTRDASGLTPAVRAFRDAMAQEAGNFNTSYMQVSIGSSSNSSSSSSSSARKLQQSSSSSKPQVVRLTFYGMAPNNASSLLTNLETNCLTGMVPGQPLAGDCQAALVDKLTKAGALRDPSALSVTPISQPQLSLDVSIAVSFNNSQVAAGADKLSAAFLNSSTIVDILQQFNLTARPTDFINTVFGGNRTAPFWQVLSRGGLLAPPSAGGGGGTSNTPGTSPAPPGTDTEVPSGGSRATARDKGFYAGIAVAVAVAVAAIVGLVVMVVRRRAAASAGQQKGEGMELTAAGAPGGPSNRRRRNRPRMYHNKYLPGGLPTVHVDSPAQQDSTGASSSSSHARSSGASSSRGAAAASTAVTGLRPGEPASGHAGVDLPAPCLERGDSVMSAIRFELDEGEGPRMSSGGGSGSGSESGSAHHSEDGEAAGSPTTPSAAGSRPGRPERRGRGNSSHSSHSPPPSRAERQARRSHATAVTTSSSSGSSPLAQQHPMTVDPVGGPGAGMSAFAVGGYPTAGGGSWQYAAWPGNMQLLQDGSMAGVPMSWAADGTMPIWQAGMSLGVPMSQQQGPQPLVGMMSYWGSSMCESADLDLVSNRLNRAPTAPAETDAWQDSSSYLEPKKASSCGLPSTAYQMQQQQQQLAQQQYQQQWQQQQWQQGHVPADLIARASNIVLERKVSINRLAAAAPLAAVAQPGSSSISSSSSPAGDPHQSRGASSSDGSTVGAEQPFSPPPVHFLDPAAAAARLTPGTPPVTPVTPFAAGFALMSQQLASSSRAAAGASGQAAAAAEEVTPLGASCWHSSGHTSGFKLSEGEAAQHGPAAAGAAPTAAAPASSKPAASAYVSPFAALAAWEPSDD